MTEYTILCESGVEEFTVKAHSFNTLARTINLKNVWQVKEGATVIWEHPEGMPYEFS